jgi:hypothetical protein
MDAVRRIFRVFDDGVVFKWLVVCLFALEALIVIVSSLGSSYRLLRLLRDVRFLEGLADVILVGAFLLAALLVVVILSLRGVAEVITWQGPKYSPLSLCAKVLRVNGEASLLWLLVLAPAGCLAAWLSGGQLIGVLPFSLAYSTSGTFLVGVAVLLSGLLYALLTCFLAYLLAEILDWIPAVAANVAAIRNAKSGRS